MKTEYHSDKCNYCPRRAIIFTSFLSGEPVSICNSGGCHDRHEELQASEHDDFKNAGLLG